VPFMHDALPARAAFARGLGSLRPVREAASFPLPAVPRWAWRGRAALFELLDANGDGAIDAYELREGLGEDALQLARRGRIGAIPRYAWRGSARVFDALDMNGDGKVDDGELRDGVAHHAARLADEEPLFGPVPPSGAAHGWKGSARWITFKDREDKARYMADAARHDASDPAIRHWAEAFRALPRPERERAILRFCQRCLRYERDPAWLDDHGARHGIELLDSSSVGLLRGYGDCDLKARVFVALCLASAVPAEIEPVFRGQNGFPHVRARVLRPEPMMVWETADPTIVNSEIGRLPSRPLTTSR
jgi:hypothetical protein